MRGNKNIPKLRFKEFRNEWTYKRLNEIAEINPSNNDLPDRFIYIDLESVVKGQLLRENEIFKIGSPSRAQRLLRKNDILFQMVRPYQMNNLFFEKNGDYVASTGYAQIRTKENSKFIYQYLHLQPFVDNVIERCTGTSYPSINSTDLGSIPLKYPTLPEQQKIATFLSTIDEKIQQLTRKKELLEQYKKGVMQQLFSGKLRFKDENGKAYPKWEEKKIGDIFTFKQGVQCAVEDQYVTQENGYVRFIRIVDLTKNDEPIRYIKDPGKEHYVKKRDLFMVRYGNPGILGYGYDGVIANNLFRIISLVNNLDTKFFKYVFKYMKSDLDLLASSSTMPALNFTSLRTLDLKVPDFGEQQKIASYLSSLDTKIESVATQITQSQTFKKGLLQQMFV